MIPHLNFIYEQLRPLFVCFVEVANHCHEFPRKLLSNGESLVEQFGPRSLGQPSVPGLLQVAFCYIGKTDSTPPCDGGQIPQNVPELLAEAFPCNLVRVPVS